NRLTLGQVSVPDGSHEAAVIPELLAMLDLNGAIVTLDAGGCQAAAARQIVAQGGDYLITVKGNRPKLHAEGKRAFGDDLAPADRDTTTDDGHGRREERTVTVIPDPTGLPADWPDVHTVVRVDRMRTAGGSTETTTHYYVSSHRG